MRGRLVSLFCALFALASCAAPPPSRVAALGTAENPARPALWKVADEDTTLYLFGTIHLLPADFEWVTPAIENAAQKSSELVLEVGDLDDERRTAGVFMALGTSPDQPPLTTRVPADQRARLAGLVMKSGIPPALLDRFETWAAALTLSAGMMRDLKLSPELGVERILQKQFALAGKPVSGLETSEQQLGYFDALPEAAQRVFLTSLIEEQGRLDAEFAKMLDAWARGDDRAIAISFDDELRLSPELAEVLIRKRNANWTDWLAKRMDRPGTVLVAVGAGHLAGKDSVQAMLKARGWKVDRVQ